MSYNPDDWDKAITELVDKIAAAPSDQILNLTEKFHELMEEAFDAGSSEGHDEGYDEGYDEGFEQGKATAEDE